MMRMDLAGTSCALPADGQSCIRRFMKLVRHLAVSALGVFLLVGNFACSTTEDETTSTTVVTPRPVVVNPGVTTVTTTGQPVYVNRAGQTVYVNSGSYGSASSTREGPQGGEVSTEAYRGPRRAGYQSTYTSPSGESYSRGGYRGPHGSAVRVGR